MTSCLNCGAELDGAFCSACGQRSVPADPTVAELAGDAWQELSGYDGRIAATFRSLLQPGRLTLDYLSGKRARYLSPLKLYFTLSLIYFNNPGDRNVKQANISSGSLGPAKIYMDALVPGSTVTFDNIRVVGPDGQTRTIQNPPGFSLY